MMAQETGFLPLMKKAIVFLFSPATVNIWDVNQLMRVRSLSLSLFLPASPFPLNKMK